MLEEFIKHQAQELIKRQAKEVKHQQEKEVKYQQDQKAMIEFNDRDLRELQEVDGIVLQDVHGQRVAIGKGFDYGNVFVFMSAYFKKYGVDDFAKQTCYEDDIDMFKSWFSSIPFNESDLMDWVYTSFHGISADSLQDPYDHENEDRLEAEDHKLDQERGK